jgi:hypothetical protein
MRLIFIVFALVGFGAWPLFLVYVHEVFWPSANLGVVGALQLAGSLVAALAWRPTGAGVMRRARLAAAALVAAGAALAVIRVPVEHRAAELATLAITLVAAAALTTVRLALLEVAHRSVDERSSVRAFTLLDVVASTSLQIGLLAGRPARHRQLEYLRLDGRSVPHLRRGVYGSGVRSRSGPSATPHHPDLMKFRRRRSAETSRDRVQARLTRSSQSSEK